MSISTNILNLGNWGTAGVSGYALGASNFVVAAKATAANLAFTTLKSVYEAKAQSYGDERTGFETTGKVAGIVASLCLAYACVEKVNAAGVKNSIENGIQWAKAGAGVALAGAATYASEKTMNTIGSVAPAMLTAAACGAKTVSSLSKRGAEGALHAILWGAATIGSLALAYELTPSPTHNVEDFYL